MLFNRCLQLVEGDQMIFFFNIMYDLTRKQPAMVQHWYRCDEEITHECKVVIVIHDDKRIAPLRVYAIPMRKIATHTRPYQYRAHHSTVR